MQTTIWEAYLAGFAVLLVLLTALWLISIPLRNVSIVDIFWGGGFVAANLTYWVKTEVHSTRGLLVLFLTAVWGLRLSLHLGIRNLGKGEDYRYAEFRKRYGEERYWWFSFFQVFLLQGVLLWLISSPLLAAQISDSNSFSWLDPFALMFWVTGFTFETGGDYQLVKFKANPANKGRVLRSGFWKYTRHPNYFGDAMVWWGFALFGVAAGAWWSVLSAVLMNFLLLKVSGVLLLERSLTRTKPEYEEYTRQTPAFFPWFPKSKTL